MKILKSLTIHAFIVSVGISGVYLFILFIPTLHTEESAEYVKIKTLSLGEYYTPVEFLKIYEVDGNRNVVSLEAKDKSSRIHTVTIKPGVNNFDDMYLNGYIVSYPSTNYYKFKSKVQYRAFIKWSSHSESVTFELSSNT